MEFLLLEYESDCSFNSAWVLHHVSGIGLLTQVIHKLRPLQLLQVILTIEVDLENLKRYLVLVNLSIEDLLVVSRVDVILFLLFFLCAFLIHVKKLLRIVIDFVGVYLVQA